MKIEVRIKNYLLMKVILKMVIHNLIDKFDDNLKVDYLKAIIFLGFLVIHLNVLLVQDHIFYILVKRYFEFYPDY